MAHVPEWAHRALSVGTWQQHHHMNGLNPVLMPGPLGMCAGHRLAQSGLLRREAIIMGRADKLLPMGTSGHSPYA